MTGQVLANAFSINMLSGDALIRFERLTEEQFRLGLRVADFVSAIGHEGTAHLLSQRLGITVPFNRITVSCEPGMLLYVAQVKGRLPEGKVLDVEELKAVQIEYWLVSQEH